MTTQATTTTTTTTRKQDIFTTEFDERGGFAVVDAFFHSSTSKTATEGPPGSLRPPASPSHPNHPNHHHRGVGATIGTYHNNNSNNIETKHSKILSSSVQKQGSRILQVGSKKRQRHDDDEEEEHDNTGVTDHAIHNDDDDNEEDIGRTGIVNDNDVRRNMVLQKPPPPTTKRKKLGRKERQPPPPPLNIDATVTSVSVIVKTKDQPLHHTTTNVISTITANEAVRDTDADAVAAISNDHPTNKKKKYRKKVRSKQKNIRKDHRDVPPLHLFRRPLTAETRAKLQAPKIV